MDPQPAVFVYGAAGHTGRFVVQRLRARGRRVVAAGRSRDKLQQVAADGAVEVVEADLADARLLAHALDGCDVAINCAGPFLDTAEPLVRACLRAGRPYLDVTAEQASAQALFDAYDGPAKAAGVAVVPGMGFYGGLGDLLASAVMGDWPDAEAIEIAIALDSWRPTEGTRRTGARNTAVRQVLRGGALAPLESSAEPRQWTFAAPFGAQPVVELPFTETVLIARHLQVRSMTNLLAAKALADIRDPATPPPTPTDASGRSDQQFRMECVVRRAGDVRRGAVQGQDIYAVTAPLVVEAAERLARSGAAGVFAPGAVLDAADVLRALSAESRDLRLPGD